jgi:hypothetical protein
MNCYLHFQAGRKPKRRSKRFIKSSNPKHQIAERTPQGGSVNDEEKENEKEVQVEKVYGQKENEMITRLTRCGLN